MKTSLLVLFTTGVFLILTAGSCLQGKHVTGSKNYLTKKVEVGQFNEVKLSSSANVTYHQGSQNYIEIYGSDNIIPLLETYVDGNTLIIKYKKNVTIWKGKLEVKVFSPELNKLTINGSGDIRLANGIQTKEDISLSINGSGDIKGEKFKCRRMTVSINGSGDVKLQQIESKECIASIAGSGDIGLSGKTLYAEYKIAGSGNIGADNLKSENVSASTSGSGSISCHVTGKLKVRVTGSGDIAYRGNPQEIDAPRKNIRQIK
ncbi:head GIN domain-containing protein [Bacteroides acidifaciens]|uniref:head GIN domain-containing protein n=1 Tax=Bacteroides acidifaciens TaxID=85831 RepID=UPI0025AA0BB2|nr:head GIN domain-containing protein [Bacteroides acidifaciens]